MKRLCVSVDGIQWVLACGCPRLAATVAESEQGALDVLLFLRSEDIVMIIL